MTEITSSDMSAAHAAFARIGSGSFRTEIEVRPHIVLADEPSDDGDSQAGPTPFGLLYSALLSCMLITVRMYATRKEWPLDGAEMKIFPTRRNAAAPLESARIEVRFLGSLDQPQLERLTEIAGKCPIHKTLAGSVDIEVIRVDGTV
ncbi:MAG: OsmC family protein [Planctomycetota bacterium]